MNDSVFLVEDEFLVVMEIQDLIEEVGLKVDGFYVIVVCVQFVLLESIFFCVVFDVCLCDGEIFLVVDELQVWGILIIFYFGYVLLWQFLDCYFGVMVCEKFCLFFLLVWVIEQVMSVDWQVV